MCATGCARCIRRARLSFTLTTRGDQILDRTLSKVGGKGLFVKELETALLDGRADLAVHSLKDVPVDLQAPFELCAVLERADPRDAFVSNTYATLAELPAGAVVGTSSLRREAQIRARHPQLAVKPLRGNLDTRLGKLDRGDYDAIVLAAAGLERLGLGGRIRSLLDPAVSLPAAGQGALGIEIRDDRDDMRAWLAPLVSAGTRACVLAERAVSRELGGSCQVPLAAFAELNGDALRCARWWLRRMACAWCAPSAAARRPRPRRSAWRLPANCWTRARPPSSKNCCKTTGPRDGRPQRRHAAARGADAALGAQRGPGRAPAGAGLGSLRAARAGDPSAGLPGGAAHAGRLRHGCLRQRQRGAPVPGPADPRARRLSWPRP